MLRSQVPPAYSVEIPVCHIENSRTVVGEALVSRWHGSADRGASAFGAVPREAQLSPSRLSHGAPNKDMIEPAAHPLELLGAAWRELRVAVFGRLSRCHLLEQLDLTFGIDTALSAHCVQIA